MQKHFKMFWLFVALLAVGCAGPPKRVNISQPQVQTVATEAFEARMTPLMLDNPYYVAFQLEIRNKTRDPLSIDWNRTRYLHNGKDQGRFVFKGIDPESIKSGIPEEAVAGGQILSKRIFPLKTLAFLSKGDIPKPGQSNFFPGILPYGDNSVLLFVRQAGHKWRETLTVRLVSKKVQ